MANTFHLKIVTVDGLAFEGDVQKVTFRSTHGDLAIMARHINYCTPIGMGTARVLLEDGTERTAACIGGMVAVHSGAVRLVATTFEWAEQIDMDRAKAAEEKARRIMSGNNVSERDLKLAEAKLHRALVRQSVHRGL